MLDLRKLRLLRELRHRGTITAVAEALAYSPSAVSQQLAALERETGASLLERVGRRVRLTPEAELLADHADVLLEQAERAEAALAARRKETAGVLRVAAFQSALLTIVPEAMVRAEQRHPGLRVEATELEPEDALPALVAGLLDLAVGEEYPGHPVPRRREVERRDLVADELFVVVPAAWEVRGPGDLDGRPLAMEPEGTAARQWATAVCRRAGFEPDVRHVSADLQIHLRLAEAGLAAALLPQLSGALDRAGVRTLRLPGRPRRQLFTVVRRGAGAHPTVRAFADALDPQVPDQRAWLASNTPWP